VCIAGVCALFACSILSSTWAANKAIGGAKVFKIIATSASSVPATLQKPH
jgi:hypothetical protein